jgi:hypothetical protein
MPRILPASSCVGLIVASRISTTRDVFSSTTPIAIIEPDPMRPNSSSEIITIATPNAAPSNSVESSGSSDSTCGTAAAIAAPNSVGSPPRSPIRSVTT